MQSRQSRELKYVDIDVLGVSHPAFAVSVRIPHVSFAVSGVLPAASDPDDERSA